MRTALFILLLPTLSFAAEIRDFNQSLMQDLKKDIEKTEAESYRRKSPGRTPASVIEADEGASHVKEDKKLDKNVRQLGSKRW
jgi:hypothetical protein